MKIAIVYHSKTGTVKKCAKILKDEIGEVDLIDLEECQCSEELCEYDFIILGGAFYYGSISRKIKKYIKKNIKHLKTREYAIFACCVVTDKYRELLCKDLGEQVVKNAIMVECFGYEIKPEKAKGFTKFVLNIVKKAFYKESKSLNNLDEDKIKRFANIINTSQYKVE